MIISGDSDKSTKKLHLNFKQTQILAFALFAIAAIILCYISYVTIRYKDVTKYSESLESSLSSMQDEMSNLSSANASLQAENEELQASIDQISKALNIMVQDEEETSAAEAEAALPKGFPLASQSSYELRKDDPNSDSKDDADSGNYILVFSVSSDSHIVASGDGIIQTVTADSKYGKCVTIDHGNGYISMYRCSGNVLVDEGDSVKRGDTLILSDDDTTLGYQIQYNNEYVNPEDMIEISG